METFRNLAQTWNQLCFGNIFTRKKQCQARLEGIQKSLDGWRSTYLEQLESSLMSELNYILRLEDAFWRQKAKCN